MEPCKPGGVFVRAVIRTDETHSSCPKEGYVMSRRCVDGELDILLREQALNKREAGLYCIKDHCWHTENR